MQLNAQAMTLREAVLLLRSIVDGRRSAQGEPAQGRFPVAPMGPAPSAPERRRTFETTTN
jgi:hypothetical protein